MTALDHRQRKLRSKAKRAPALPKGTAAASRAGSDLAEDRIHLSWLPSPLGPLVIGATQRGVCLVEFKDPERFAPQLETISELLDVPTVAGKNEHLDKLEAELEAYFAGKLREFTVPLVHPGTPFQERVWTALRSIPYGVTWSYAELARAVGAERGQRAVGRANGANRIAILIPCHRVVNQGGQLGGYGGGLERKEFLLGLERKQLT